MCIRKAKSKIEVLELSEVIEEITAFVIPVLDSLQMETPFEQRWTPGAGWQSSIAAEGLTDKG